MKAAGLDTVQVVFATTFKWPVALSFGFTIIQELKEQMKSGSWLADSLG